MTSYVLTVTCKSTRGIVAAITGFLAEKGCNIVDSSQFDDLETGMFFMRLTFAIEEGATIDEIVAGFRAIEKQYGMTASFHDGSAKMKVLLMVSRFGHCLNDLLYRWKIGAMPIDIVGVVSNHFDYQKVVVNHDIPFHHVNVTKANKPEAEARLMEIVNASGAELIVLARYMQVLSDDICKKMSGRIINIHHSFLPSFKGANPYKQAFERGVKLIGATAHYVTADLDEGPIIEQDPSMIRAAVFLASLVSTIFLVSIPHVLSNMSHLAVRAYAAYLADAYTHTSLSVQVAVVLAAAAALWFVGDIARNVRYGRTVLRSA